MADAVPLLFDTDIGSDIDDAVCLSYLLAEPRCQLLGVSTVTGEAQKRAMLADAICRVAGRTDVPVWSGAEQPLLVSQGQPAAPQAEVLPRWPHREDFPANEAVCKLRQVIRERPGEVTLLTVGPLTNIGLLFALDPLAAAMLKRMVIMGGMFFGDRMPEWNIKCDPHAAAVVFRAPVPEVRVCGLDVTTKCQKSAEECRRRFRGGPLDVVAQMAEVWFRHRELITFHDPLAGVCAFEPNVCTWRRGRVDVLHGDPKLAGLTALAESAEGAHFVADTVNPDRFFELYFQTVGVFG